MYLSDNSSLIVEGTSSLSEGFGGIWEIDLGVNSHLNMSGGQVHELNIGNDATAYLSGGLIQQIWSSQWVPEIGGHGEPGVPQPHITIECLDHFYNDTTNLLTGYWLDDGLPFSIHLIDVESHSPTIDNIQFVPEPATLMLLCLGSIAVRKRFNR